MRLWGLQARGPLAQFSGTATVRSLQVFATRSRAWEHAPEFRRRCVTPRSALDLTVLEDGANLEIKLAPIEAHWIDVCSLALLAVTEAPGKFWDACFRS